MRTVLLIVAALAARPAGAQERAPEPVAVGAAGAISARTGASPIGLDRRSDR